MKTPFIKVCVYLLDNLNKGNHKVFTVIMIELVNYWQSSFFNHLWLYYDMICSNMDIDNDIVDKECRLGKYKYTFLWFTLEQPNMVTGIKLKCQTVFFILQCSILYVWCHHLLHFIFKTNNNNWICHLFRIKTCR